MEIFPRPTLWALPSPVVTKGADVTLRCQGRLGSDRFQLWMDGELREERNDSWSQADFVLRKVDDWRDARSYRCRSGKGPLWSEYSEPLALMVTGEGCRYQTILWGKASPRRGAPHPTLERLDGIGEIRPLTFFLPPLSGAFSKPKIGALQGHLISPGETVTIWCQMFAQYTTQDYSFALLDGKSLEPLLLQIPVEPRIEFSFPSLGTEDTGSYRCIYYKKTPPHRASHLSPVVKLTVPGQLPRPTLWAQPGVVVVPGTNITFWCSRPRLASSEEVTYTLWKMGTQQPLQNQKSADLWTGFSLPSVRPEDTGSYRCTYKNITASGAQSEFSEALELGVTGSLPKPSLSALPGLVVEPGQHVTLQCRKPPQSALWTATFTLLKMGSPQPLQSQNTSGSSAYFPLLSVRAQDAGNYTCVYSERMAPYRVSEPSDALEIWVTDALPKPSLSAWPGLEVALGSNVILLCWGPSWIPRFVLYKKGVEGILHSMEAHEDRGRFFLTHVTSKDSGNYSCSYQLGTKESLWKQSSDVLELLVREPSNNLIIIFSCVFFLFFLLCLLLLALHYHGSIPLGSLQEYIPKSCFCCSCLPWNTCKTHHAEAPREERPYEEETRETTRGPLVPMANDPQEVIYTQLNIKTLNKRKTDTKKTPTEATLDATVYLD
ncbi:immunoglobulin superfamily member 1-like [Antechinus flavipes]|uniref:immunoglobulin superfamily member 1-like n=1 Tax=Antechinus flavipes TaxID=38775 RepID=UPI002236860D|nr:immunoglobulin superfamily member 1-like [Antechinus flavipes]